MIIKKKTHWKLIVFLLAATINALFNFILIPKLGILGAGIATTISSLIAAVFGLIISNKLFFVPNRWVFSFSFILLATAIVSFSQHQVFIVNYYENLFTIRLALTLLFISFAGISYYEDIQRTSIVQDFIQKISSIIKRHNGPQSGCEGKSSRSVNSKGTKDTSVSDFKNRFSQ